MEDLQELHKKASLTLMVLLIKMGRLSLYDKVMEKYPCTPYDAVSLRFSVGNLFLRCLDTFEVLVVVRKIFRNFTKHKTVYQTLAEHGIYMNRPGFNTIKT